MKKYKSKLNDKIAIIITDKAAGIGNLAAYSFNN